MNLFDVDERTRCSLEPFGFDVKALQLLAEKLALPKSENTIQGVLSSTTQEDVVPLPALGTPERAALRQKGAVAICNGEVAVVILAGGMGTRFGGVVKAVVPVLKNRSFLELKHSSLKRLCNELGVMIPIWVMSSYATHEVICQHISERRLCHPAVDVFPQFVSLRFTPEGTLFRGRDGALSAYATGHGDFTFALRRSGLLERFRQNGGKLLMMSNVDNLGATLDPAIIGFHLSHGLAITAEVVQKDTGDQGGAPMRLNGMPQIVENFRLPPDFNQASISVLNTNTFVMDAAALDCDFTLPFYRVEKKVDEKTAIQFERLIGELTAFLPTRFVKVLRGGRDARFLPVKDPEMLAFQLPMIDLALSAYR